MLIIIYNISQFNKIFLKNIRKHSYTDSDVKNLNKGFHRFSINRTYIS